MHKPTRSHFVPKAYLKKFTKKNGRLFRLKKKVKNHPKLEECHPSSICYQPGFYEFSKEHPLQGFVVTESNFLEERGFLYENRLNKWIEGVIGSARIVPQQDAYDLAAALFNLKIRNPYYREHSYSEASINSSIDDVLEREKQKWEAGQSIAQLRGIPFEVLDRIVENLREEWTTDKGFIKELHNRSLLENAHNPSQVRQWIYYKLATARWVILQTTIANQFICSDNPGFCIDEENKIHNIKFGGFCRFIVPLTSYHALAIVTQDNEIKPLTQVKAIEHLNVSSEEAKVINYGTWVTANKELYAAYEQPLLQTQYAINGSNLII